MFSFEEEIELIKTKALVDLSYLGIKFYEKLEYITLVKLNVVKHIYENFDPSKKNIVIDFNMDYTLKPFMMSGYRSYNPCCHDHSFYYACMDLEQFIDSNRFNNFKISITILNDYFSLKKEIHLCDIIFNINYITANCNSCGRELIAYYGQKRRSGKCTLVAKIDDFSYCCDAYKNAVNSSTRGNADNYSKRNFEAFKDYFETKSINRGKFTMVDIYTFICKENNHTFRPGGYISARKLNQPMTCWICDEHLDEKYKLFSILKRFGCNYRIEARDKSTVSLKGVSREERKLLPLTIYTMDNNGGLTGKIVFDDLLGEQQAKANSNGLVFRWFEMQYINDFEYCKQFLYDFFKEIIDRQGKKLSLRLKKTAAEKYAELKEPK